MNTVSRVSPPSTLLLLLLLLLFLLLPLLSPNTNILFLFSCKIATSFQAQKSVWLIELWHSARRDRQIIGIRQLRRYFFHFTDEQQVCEESRKRRRKCAENSNESSQGMKLWLVASSYKISTDRLIKEWLKEKDGPIDKIPDKNTKTNDQRHRQKRQKASKSADERTVKSTQTDTQTCRWEATKKRRYRQTQTKSQTDTLRYSDKRTFKTQ